MKPSLSLETSDFNNTTSIWLHGYYKLGKPAIKLIIPCLREITFITDIKSLLYEIIAVTTIRKNSPTWRWLSSMATNFWLTVYSAEHKIGYQKKNYKPTYSTMSYKATLTTVAIKTIFKKCRWNIIFRRKNGKLKSWEDNGSRNSSKSKMTHQLA